MKLIGISGKMGVGKTTAAKYLTDHYGFVEVSFADKIKEMVSVLCGVDKILLNNQDFKNSPSPFGCTYRHLLQTLGTNWGRDLIDSDIWITAALNNITAPTVISDVRFRNEAHIIGAKGGILIRIERDMERGGEIHNHPSETALDDFPFFHYTIYNNGTIDDLYEKLGTIML